jgi:hypothetical protein
MMDSAGSGMTIISTSCHVCTTQQQVVLADPAPTAAAFCCALLLLLQAPMLQASLVQKTMAG